MPETKIIKTVKSISPKRVLKKAQKKLKVLKGTGKSAMKKMKKAA